MKLQAIVQVWLMSCRMAANILLVSAGFALYAEKKKCKNGGFFGIVVVYSVKFKTGPNFSEIRTVVLKLKA